MAGRKQGSRWKAKREILLILALTSALFLSILATSDVPVVVVANSDEGDDQEGAEILYEWQNGTYHGGTGQYDVYDPNKAHPWNTDPGHHNPGETDFVPEDKRGDSVPYSPYGVATRTRNLDLQYYYYDPNNYYGYPEGVENSVELDGTPGYVPYDPKGSVHPYNKDGKSTSNITVTVPEDAKTWAHPWGASTISKPRGYVNPAEEEETTSEQTAYNNFINSFDNYIVMGYEIFTGFFPQIKALPGFDKPFTLRSLMDDWDNFWTEADQP